MVEAYFPCVYEEILEGVVPGFAYGWMLRGWDGVEVMGAFKDLAPSAPSNHAAGPDNHPMGAYED